MTLTKLIIMKMTFYVVDFWTSYPAQVRPVLVYQLVWRPEKAEQQGDIQATDHDCYHNFCTLAFWICTLFPSAIVAATWRHKPEKTEITYLTQEGNTKVFKKKASVNKIK